MAQDPGIGREILPIPDIPVQAEPALHAGDTAAPPIVPLRPPEGAPNVLIVLIDDMGFGCTSAVGGPVEMPTLDRLAAAGLSYNRFHTTALCSPTRQALLTGRNHHSVGMGCLANFDSGFPGYRGKIAADAPTIAELLRPHGYRNYLVGKWHATRLTETGPTGPFDGWPLGRGFDRYYGFLDAETDQYSPELVRDNTHVAPPGTYETGYDLTADLVDEAIGFVAGHHAVTPDLPWFLMVAPGACHAPHQAPRPLIDKYVPVFEKGWDRTRADRLARVTLDYKDLLSRGNRTATADVRATRTADREASVASTQRTVKRTVLAFQAGDALRAASTRLERGDVQGARSLLAERQRLLTAASDLWSDRSLAEDARLLGRYERVLAGAWPSWDSQSRRTMMMAMSFYGDRRMR